MSHYINHHSTLVFQLCEFAAVFRLIVPFMTQFGLTFDSGMHYYMEQIILSSFGCKTRPNHQPSTTVLDSGYSMVVLEKTSFALQPFQRSHICLVFYHHEL
ncbi:hypothetical protein ILYODFUR_028065 [Ilyodon furcidens]|uniref:Uncharacterized protein n=1 Tax=Ilyodon furcidens TaxID=33524 RepID=A0ABV0TZI8_9TELE